MDIPVYNQRQRSVTMYTIFAPLVFCVLLLASVGSASPLLVQESGVWGNSAPFTTWSAPGESWSYSFLIDSNPTPSSYSPGDNFIAPFNNFNYFLNGFPVATTPDAIEWYSTNNEGGLINIYFGTTLFKVYGAQAYSGPESSPTILPGVYPLAGGSVFQSAGNPDQPLTGYLTITPEPATIGMMLMGVAALAGLPGSAAAPDVARSPDHWQFCRSPDQEYEHRHYRGRGTRRGGVDVGRAGVSFRFLLRTNRVDSKTKSRLNKKLRDADASANT
jgi:hypothetical protein